MISTIIEISAVIAESFLALAFNVGYFKMKDNKYHHLKMALRKNLCKFKNSDKKRYCGAA